jgi:hypothetical protein
MPIELQYRDDETGVVFVCSGVVNGADFIEANEEIYAPERLERLRYQLIDFSATERIEISSEQIREYAAMDVRAAARNPSLVVAVAGPTPITFGLSRMWQALVDESGIRSGVFHTVAEAESWLGEVLANR